jgi:hypothetical protein
MKAKKKQIEKVTPGSLGVDLTPVLETVGVSEPPKRVGGGKVCVFYLYRYVYTPERTHSLGRIRG